MPQQGFRNCLHILKQQSIAQHAYFDLTLHTDEVNVNGLTGYP